QALNPSHEDTIHIFKQRVFDVEAQMDISAVASTTTTKWLANTKQLHHYEQYLTVPMKMQYRKAYTHLRFEQMDTMMKW
ncbi:hypothetical protein JRQ81_017590, partial [Phrynocephalus forsythii]